jgi:GNAT superfamily N-acetyltransferase
MTDLVALTESTWPPAATHAVGPWLIREGCGGGQRVSAASPAADWQDADISKAEVAMQDLGQKPLFVIWPQDGALDAALEARGYRKHDPVVIYAAATADLAAKEPPFLSSFPHWPPLGIARALWAEAGIGPARLAVMDRVTVAKTAILGRTGDRAAGVAFVAATGNCAMLHALEVSPALRRQGTAHNILWAAARWSLDQRAAEMFLLVTEANSNARHLYTSLGMSVVGQYHYRVK